MASVRKTLTIKTKRQPEAINAQIVELERLAKKRAGKPGYGASVADIEKLLADCRMELGDG